jgi:acyl-CoA synthetase (AMP-forming)/AMP-acid ligase II
MLRYCFQAVEAALLELPMVNAAYISVEGDEGSDKFLVAYIVSEGKVTQKEVRDALKNRLPFYMIPSKFIFIDRQVTHFCQFNLF